MATSDHVPRPSQPNQRVRIPLSRRIVSALTERLQLKAAALFFALVLWFVVSATEPSEQLIPVRFNPLLDSTLTLVEAPPQVQALVIGRTRELLKLYASPPTLRRLVDADVPDTVTIELRPTDVDLPAGVQAIVRDVQPRNITLRFATSASRTLPVRSALTVVADTGIRITGGLRLEPDSVRVTGDRRALGRINAVSTIAGQLRVRDSSAVIVSLDTARLGVLVRPAQVRVSVPITRTIPAADSARGDSATGRPAT